MLYRQADSQSDRHIHKRARQKDRPTHYSAVHTRVLDRHTDKQGDSQKNTHIQTCTDRITRVLNRHTTVP